MKKMRTVLITAMIALFAVLTPVNSFAQDAKLEKAEAKFCKTIEGFITALINLDNLSLDCTYQEFNKAYNKAGKAWNKMVKSADKLENVAIKESVKAYNELAEAVNLINSDSWTNQTATKVNKHVDNSSEITVALQSMHCK